MFPPASYLLSLLLVIDAGGAVPSPQGVPHGCYAAEEAGERTFRCSQAGLSAVHTIQLKTKSVNDADGTKAQGLVTYIHC